MTSFGHADHPLRERGKDTLGLAPYAESLADFIRLCATPLTIAIQGDWGTGKTSLMRMVEDALGQGSPGAKIETVWFNTWQYSQFAAHDALPVSLLSKLAREISGEGNPIVAGSLKLIRRWMKPALNAALRTATMGASELGDFADSDDAVDAALLADQLKGDIKKLVDKKLKSGTDRIIIFIDDLDRILPERAVEILETIKLFLDWEGCVFVLALDYEVVRRGLRTRFNLTEEELGRSFFDKIIQLPFAVPTSRFNVESYIKGLFQQMQLPMQEGDERIFGELVRHSVSTNPRGIKRVFNSLQLLMLVAQKQGILHRDADSMRSRLMIRNLFAVLCLQLSYEPIYRWLSDLGQHIEEADLLALLPEDGGHRSHHPDLTAALSNMNETERLDFEAFARIFLECIQMPGEPLTSIDDAELGRLRETLTLSRITAVIPQPAAVQHDTQEREFRWRNRVCMGRLRDSLQESLRDIIKQTGRSFWSYQSHSNPAVCVERHIDQDRKVRLGINHSLDRATLYVSGGVRAMKRAKPALEAALKPMMPLYRENPEGTWVLLAECTIPQDMPVDDREALLFRELKGLYVAASEAIDGKF